MVTWSVIWKKHARSLSTWYPSSSTAIVRIFSACYSYHRQKHRPISVFERIHFRLVGRPVVLCAISMVLLSSLDTIAQISLPCVALPLDFPHPVSIWKVLVVPYLDPSDISLPEDAIVKGTSRASDSVAMPEFSCFRVCHLIWRL